MSSKGNRIANSNRYTEMGQNGNEQQLPQTADVSANGHYSVSRCGYATWKRIMNWKRLNS